ncbi:MAG: response regulator transcription factor [Candidatus Obscuribacterales bacterium]|nr:response regulator transcription factor [Candidatus Obscuribacterales bacterium]
MKILIAEDDQMLADGLLLILRSNGYVVELVGCGLDADAALLGGTYDLLILDLGLPDMDGLEVLKRLRRREQFLPVMILTARDCLEDRVQGLDLGANDYISKPFELPELEARIRALLRKDAWSNRTEVNFGPLRFDTVSRIAEADRQRLELSARELAVLEIFLQRLGRAVTKDQVMDALCTLDSDLTENAVVISIHRLRKKLEEHRLTIRSSRGLGYRLEKLG